MRLTARFVIVSLLLLVVACARFGGPSSGAQEPTRPTTQAIGPPQTFFHCPDCQLVDVFGIVDGDTIDTSIGRVRFFGVNTPERGEACFTEATEFTRLLVGSRVRLEDGPRLEDNFGRRLAYVYDPFGNSIDVQRICQNSGHRVC